MEKLLWFLYLGCIRKKRNVRNKTFNLPDMVTSNHPYKKSWPTYRIYKIHYKTDAYDAAEKKILQVMKDSSSEVESTGGSNTSSLVRKSIQHHASSTSSESSNSDEDVCPIQSPRHTQVTEQSFDTASRYSTPNCERSEISDVSHSTENPEPSVGFQNTVLTCLAKLTANIEQHSLLLHELVRNSRKISEDIVAPADLPDFPIIQLEDFQKFNTKLQSDEVLRNYMKRRLAAVGGSTIEALTRRILKFLLANELALLYNWKGRDKLPFENTETMKIIYDAAKMNFPLNERSDYVIAASVKDWLKYAKARLNSTKK